MQDLFSLTQLAKELEVSKQSASDFFKVRKDNEEMREHYSRTERGVWMVDAVGMAYLKDQHKSVSNKIRYSRRKSDAYKMADKLVEAGSDGILSVLVGLSAENMTKVTDYIKQLKEEAEVIIA